MTTTDPRPMLDGPGPVPQYDQPAPSVYPEGGEGECRCPSPDLGPCLGDGCDVCWRTAGCERQTPAQMYAGAKVAERSWQDQVGGIATMHDLDADTSTQWRVCLCVDGQHARGDSAGDFTDEAKARQEALYIAGEKHILIVRSMRLVGVEFLGSAA